MKIWTAIINERLYLFKKNDAKGFLTENIKSIYHEDHPKVQEFHGKWGSLAVSENLYYGFQPYETSEHICVVIGGPLLYFSDVSFISDKSDRNSGTKAIYKRWLTGEMKWDDDLSGPFAICIINKNNADAFCNRLNVVYSTVSIY